jgi:phosphomannomutase / phosphoglucomutase
MGISKGIFRQYDIRGIVGRDLTEEAAYAVGRGYAAYLGRHGVAGAIVLGRDNRPSGPMLHAALARGLMECGLDVIDIGVVPTPVVYWALHHLDVAGGIQVTGSHNPPEYNGFKMSVGKSSLHGAGIEELYAIIQEGRFPSGAGEIREEHLLERYVNDLVARTGPLARPLRVAVDCGNGAGALAVPALMERLAVDYTGLFCESDGTFPNHHPDPTVVENLEELIAVVKRDKLDLGVAFDGDADRIGLVDDRGEIVWGDHLLILYARDVLERTGTGQSIIFDVKCSQALVDAVAAAGGVPVMWKTGHSLIKEKMRETGAPIAGEMSGHMFFTEGFYGHDDALYAAARLLRIVAESGKRVSEMLADVPQFVSTPEIRVDVDEERKFGIVDRAIRHFSAIHDVVDVDGIRVNYGDGWGLIRASNTQPVLVLRFEASNAARLAEIRAEFEQWLSAQGVRV